VVRGQWITRDPLPTDCGLLPIPRCPPFDSLRSLRASCTLRLAALAQGKLSTDQLTTSN